MGKTLARNKKALHDFEILEDIEAGIELKGSEVKSIRMGRVNLKDSYVRVIKNQMYLIGVHVTHASTANPHFKPDEKRDRRLLLHRKEIDKFHGKVMRDGLTIVALSMYLNAKNKVKVKIALAKGKALHDKRETLKRKEADREAKVAMKKYVKGY